MNGMRSGGKRKILFVDRNPGFLDEVESLPFRKLYAVDVACTGEEGLELIKSRGPYALIVSGYRLEGMNGIEFLKKSSEISPGSIRVLFTRYVSQQIIKAALNEAHIYWFLDKKSDCGILYGTVLAAVEQYEKELISDEIKKKLIGIKSFDTAEIPTVNL